MTLQRGSIGWKKITGLGVGLVVAGQFAGWNYGLAQGGWSNMMLATALMAGLCLALALCVAELATALPNSGGLYVYSAAAFGHLAGYGVGVAIFAALAVSTGAAAEFISAYSISATGFGGPVLKLALFGVIIAIHIRGVGEALSLLLGAGLLAVIALLIFGAAVAPSFALANLIPNGSMDVSLSGVVACIPFAIMLFLSVEQTATSAEEAANPHKDVPRGILAAILILFATAMCVLVLGTAAGGVERMGTADDPLYAAMGALPASTSRWLAPVVGIGALLGLIATLFSLIYSASRQLFALARDGYVPALLMRSGRFGTPVPALILVGVIGFPLSFIPPDKIILVMVLLLSASYMVMLAGFIRLRLTRPDLPRPFRTPGGIVTASVALALAALLFTACLTSDQAVLLIVGTITILASLWHFISARSAALKSPELALERREK